MKYLAVIPMFIGHMIAWITLMNDPGNDYAIYELPTVLLVISGLSLFCPPVMFFFIADGYKYTRDRKKYALRLLLLAVITQPFEWLIFQPVYGWRTGNVIFTLFFGLLSIICWESSFKLWQRILLIVLCNAATVLIDSDWLIFGIFVYIKEALIKAQPSFPTLENPSLRVSGNDLISGSLILHIFRDKQNLRLILYTSLILVHCLLNLFSLGKVPAIKLITYMTVMFAAFMAAYFCMTTFYNGKKGRHPSFAKWFFYIFYPTHYLIIWAVKMCTDKF